MTRLTLLVGLAVALLAAAPDDPPAASVDEPSRDVPFTLADGLIVVELRLGEHGPYRFSVDTGASGAGRIDATLAAELELEVVGQASNRDGTGAERSQSLVRVPRLTLGAQAFDDVTLLVGDYGWVRGEGSERIHGVLGYALLARTVFELDYPARRLRFGLPPLHADEADVFAYETSPGVPVIPLAVGDQAGQALLDTGHDSALSMPAAFAELLTLDGELVPAGTAVTALSRFPIHAATLADSVRIGPHVSVDGVRAHFAEAWQYPLVGFGILRAYRIRLDHARGLMRWSE